MLHYLLDTTVISETIKPSPNPQVLERLEQFQQQSAIAITTWQEILFGYHRLPDSHKKKRVEQWLYTIENFDILLLDVTAATWLAKERARLMALGLTPSYMDAEIAAIAVRHGLTLITRNTKDFVHFSEVECENWFLAR